MLEPAQQLSHRPLLASDDRSDCKSGRVDAIVVPSARTAPYLLHAAALAEQLGCPLLILASKNARAQEIVQRFSARGVNAEVIVADVPNRIGDAFPALETVRRSGFQRRTDVSLKRNLALLFARAVGWRHVVFLDDDITVPDPADLQRAVGELDRHDAVGLRIDNMPDNSVVCHAIRDLGQGDQDTFVGGGALAVPVDRHPDAFFPEVYNEDWFFLLDESKIRSVTLTGLVIQNRYDPYVNPDRAREEEFGDTLAEGIFSALTQGSSIADADLQYWEQFIHARRQLIESLIVRVRGLPADSTRDHMTAALVAARARSLVIGAKECVRFVEAWQRDRATWREAMQAVPRLSSYPEALRYFAMRQFRIRRVTGRHDGRVTVRTTEWQPRPADRPLISPPMPQASLFVDPAQLIATLRGFASTRPAVRRRQSGAVIHE